MKLNYSKKILIVSVVIFLVIFVLDIISFNFLWAKIVSLNDKVKQIDISTKEREKEMTLKDLILKTKTEREEFDRYFIGAGNLETVKFTEYLETLAKEYKVIQKKTLVDEQLKDSDLEKSEFVSVIRYKFNITGDLANISGFLSALENMPKIGYLNSVVFNSASEISKTKTWSADIDFSVIKLNK
jgi:Tfp pilus assembly protein PilO